MGSAGFRLDSGIRGVSTPRGRSDAWIHEGFLASRLDAGLRWLPKNLALTLAKCRAKPASIRFGPERNRKTGAWRSGPRLDPGSQHRCPPRDQCRSVRAHDPEYIAMDTVRGAIRLAVRCLAGKCLGL